MTFSADSGKRFLMLYLNQIELFNHHSAIDLHFKIIDWNWHKKKKRKTAAAIQLGFNKNCLLSATDYRNQNERKKF